MSGCTSDCFEASYMNVIKGGIELQEHVRRAFSWLNEKKGCRRRHLKGAPWITATNPGGRQDSSYSSSLQFQPSSQFSPCKHSRRLATALPPRRPLRLVCCRWPFLPVPAAPARGG